MLVLLAGLRASVASSAARTSTTIFSPPTLVDHPIESGLPPLYLDGAWSVSSSTPGGEPLNASVPGDILTDLQRAGRVPDPYFNSTWSEPSFVAAWNVGTWTYRKSFESPPLSLSVCLSPAAAEAKGKA